MLPVVQEYLAQCRQRRVEPYFGFIDNTRAGEVSANLDSVDAQAVRLFALALLRSGQQTTPTRGPKLQVFSLRYGIDKDAQHSVQRPKRTAVSHEALRPRSRLSDNIVAPENRVVLRTLLDGVRSVCAMRPSHLVRVELCGLPLNWILESTGRLFDVLPQCNALRVLKFNKSVLTDQLFMRLTTVPDSFRALKEAYFSECGLTDASANGIHALIQLSRSREQSAAWRASLRGNGSSASPAAPLRALEVLDLSGNRLGNASLNALGAAIGHDVSLRLVDFGRNSVTAEGLKAFLQLKSLQSSAIESLDLSKNLIGAQVDCAIGSGFMCTRTCEQQLLLTRAADRWRSSAVNEVTVMESSLSLQPSKVKTIAFEAAPADLNVPLGVCHSALAVGVESCVEPHAACFAGAPDVDNEFTLMSSHLSKYTQHDLSPVLCSTQEQRSPARTTPDVADVQSSQRRFESIHLPGSPPRSHTDHEPSNPPLPLPLPLPLPFPQPQPDSLPCYLPLLSAPSSDQRWCGVPLYAFVPLASLQVVTTGVPPSRKRDAAVGTSPSLPSGVPHEEFKQTPSTPLLCLSSHDQAMGECATSGDSTVFEQMMTEPLRTGELDLAEWREQEQRFLETLVRRVESHENAVVEMVERQYQMTCDRLGAAKEELSRRIGEVLEEQRAERERLQAELREGLSTQQKSQDPEGAIEEELVQLIHTGMKRIHKQMEKPVSGATVVSSSAVPPEVSTPSQKEFIDVVKEHLGRLGW